MPQSLAQVYVHIVFGTKHRQPLIDEEIRPLLQAYMVGILAGIGSHVEEIFANPDHVHILCSLPRTTTIASFIQTIKTSSSKWMKDKGRSHFHWQDGYSIFSVSSSKVDTVVRYISNQPTHHKKERFQDELRLFFEKYGIAYDERYVWD